MKNIILTILSMTIGLIYTYAQPKHLDSADVVYEITGIGGYNGKCVRLTIRNFSRIAQSIKLKAGTIFKSDNEDEQDLLLVENIDSLKILAGAEVSKDLYGFCCQANNKAPKMGSTFTLSKITRKKLEKLGAFIGDNLFMNLPNVQEAVWAVSDDHSVGAINYKDKDTDLMKLIIKVCELKGEKMPWYFVKYKRPSGTSLFSNEIEKVEGEITFTLNNNDEMTIVLFDSYKQTVKVFCENQPFNRGTYKYSIDLAGNLLQRGTYTLKVYNNSRLMQERIMKL